MKTSWIVPAIVVLFFGLPVYITQPDVEPPLQNVQVTLQMYDLSHFTPALFEDANHPYGDIDGDGEVDGWDTVMWNGLELIDRQAHVTMCMQQEFAAASRLTTVRTFYELWPAPEPNEPTKKEPPGQAKKEK